MGLSTSGVFREGMAAAEEGLEGLRGKWALELNSYYSVVTKSNAKFMNETDYAFNIKNKLSQRTSCGHRNRNT